MRRSPRAHNVLDVICVDLIFPYVYDEYGHHCMHDIEDVMKIHTILFPDLSIMKQRSISKIIFKSTYISGFSTVKSHTRRDSFQR